MKQEIKPFKENILRRKNVTEFSTTQIPCCIFQFFFNFSMFTHHNQSPTNTLQKITMKIFFLQIILLIFHIFQSFLCSSKIIFSIFSGRRQFLEISHHYFDIFLNLNLIDEIHYWDYTKDSINKNYLYILIQTKNLNTYSKKNSKKKQNYYIKNKQPLNFLNETNRLSLWLEFYKFYSQERNLQDDDILIKLDDDIVYYDIQTFQFYINMIKKYSFNSFNSSNSNNHSNNQQQQCNLFFPNIINNDVCAYIQTNYSIHNLLPRSEIDLKYLSYGNPDPLTGYTQFISWFLNSEKAVLIHNDFLSNINKYKTIQEPEIIQWNSRISINFFGSIGKIIRQTFQSLIENSNDDEQYLTSDYIKVNNIPNCIVPAFTVSHFSFHGQRNDYREYLLRELVPKYYELMLNETEKYITNYQSNSTTTTTKNNNNQNHDHDDANDDDNNQNNECQFVTDDVNNNHNDASNNNNNVDPSSSTTQSCNNLSSQPPSSFSQEPRTLRNMTFYLEVYSPLLLIDDPMEDEIEKWSEELKRKFYRGFGVENIDDYDIDDIDDSDDNGVDQQVNTATQSIKQLDGVDNDDNNNIERIIEEIN